MKTLTIGKVAQGAGLSVETVRFYERRGLLVEPPRNDSGYRQYPPETIRRLQFIKRAKTLGFSLKEIQELFGLRYNQEATCGDIKAQAEAKLHEIDIKIQDLGRIKKTLEELTCQCNSAGPLSDCPILAALEPPGEEP